MSATRYLRAAMVVLALLIASVSVCEAADPVGTVDSVTPGFWAMRDGLRSDLEKGSAVYELDIVATDENGAGTIVFVDGTTLDLRASSEINIMEVASTEQRARFNVGVVEGAARVVTGAIVKRNPRGFKMTTPGATIGIRGTDLSVGYSTETQMSTMSVASTENSVTMSDRETGFSVSCAAGVSVGMDSEGNISVNDVAFNVNDAASMSAAADSLSGVASISDAEGNTVGGTSDGSDGDGGVDASTSEGASDGSGGGEGSDADGGTSSTGSDGADCDSSNSSPGL